MVPQERLGHNGIEQNDKTALRLVWRNDDVVANTAQGPGQVDAEDEERVHRLRLLVVLGVVDLL